MSTSLTDPSQTPRLSILESLLPGEAFVPGESSVSPAAAPKTAAEVTPDVERPVWRDGRYLVPVLCDETTEELVLAVADRLAQCGLRQKDRKLVRVTGNQKDILPYKEKALELEIKKRIHFVSKPPTLSPTDFDELHKKLEYSDAQIKTEEAKLELYKADVNSAATEAEEAKRKAAPANVATDDIKKRKCEKRVLSQTADVEKLKRQRDVVQKTLDDATRDPELGELGVKAPYDLARTMLEKEDYPVDVIPEVKGLKHVPFFREDRSLCSTPGFDLQSGYFVSDNVLTYGDLSGPYTQADAIAAAKRLKYVFIDVPGSDVMRAGLLSLSFTLLIRNALAKVPMFNAEGNRSRIGKTQATEAAVEIGTGGQRPPTITFKDMVELEKHISSRLQNATPGAIVIDNVEGAFESALITSIITLNGQLESRIFGTTDLRLTQPGWTLAITANNPTIGGDLSMRTIPIRLFYEGDRPDLRTGFVHEEPLTFTKLHVKELTHDALVILLAHRDAGYPQPDEITMGSFEDWIKYVRAAAMWCGLEDPCADREELVSEDANTAFVKIVAPALLKVDPDGKGLWASEIKDKASAPSLAAALEAVALRTPRGDVNTKSLGKALKKIKGLNAGGIRITSKNRGNQAAWYVQQQNATTGFWEP